MDVQGIRYSLGISRMSLHLVKTWKQPFYDLIKSSITPQRIKHNNVQNWINSKWCSEKCVRILLANDHDNKLCLQLYTHDNMFYFADKFCNTLSFPDTYTYIYIFSSMNVYIVVCGIFTQHTRMQHFDKVL